MDDKEQPLTKFVRIWEDVFAFIMFAGAAGLAFGTLWVGIDPPGANEPHDGIIKVAQTSIGTVIGAAIMFLRGKR